MTVTIATDPRSRNNAVTAPAASNPKPAPKSAIVATVEVDPYVVGGSGLDDATTTVAPARSAHTVGKTSRMRTAEAAAVATRLTVAQRPGHRIVASALAANVRAFEIA